MSYEPSFAPGDFDGHDFDTGEFPILVPPPPKPPLHVYRPRGTFELSSNKTGRPRFSIARLRAKLGLAD